MVKELDSFRNACPSVEYAVCIDIILDTYISFIDIRNITAVDFVLEGGNTGIRIRSMDIIIKIVCIEGLSVYCVAGSQAKLVKGIW